MIKKKMQGYIIWIAVILIVMLLIPGALFLTESQTSWIIYILHITSIALLMAYAFSILMNEKSLNKKVLSIGVLTYVKGSIIFLSINYVVAMFLDESRPITLISFGIIILISLLVILTSNISRAAAEHIEDQAKSGRLLKDQWIYRLDMIKVKTTQPACTSLIKKVTDEMRYMDPISNSSTQQIEEDIMRMLNDMKDKDSNLIEDQLLVLLQMVQRRNQILKNNK